MRNSGRSLSIFITGLVFLAIAYGLIKFWPERSIWSRLFERNYIYAVIAILVATAISLLFRGERWRILIKESGITASRETVIAGYGWCFLVLQALPFRIGELARIIWVRTYGGSESYAVSAIIAERLIDIIMLSLVFGFGLLLMPQAIGIQTLWIFGVGFVCFGALSLLIIFSINIEDIISRLNVSWIRLDSWVRKLAKGFSQLRDFRLIARVVLLSLVAWFILGLGFQTYLVLFGFDLSPGSGFVLLALLNVSALVTISPGNLGVFEGVGVTVLHFYAIPPEEAIVAIVGLHFAVLSSQALFGLLSRVILVNKKSDFFRLI